MSAVFTGNGLGLINSSLTQLGGGIPDGSAGAGPGADRQYVNLANGNLLLQRQDEFLTFRGLGVGLNRTYNSLGQASDVGTDGWVTGFERHVALLSGTFNASGSVMRRYTGDGGFQDFTYVGANTSQATTGDGAHDTHVPVLATRIVELLAERSGVEGAHDVERPRGVTHDDVERVADRRDPGGDERFVGVHRGATCER